MAIFNNRPHRLRCPEASDMVTRMDGSKDSDLIASINPDVRASLRRSGFFEQLDDLLSPMDGSGASTAECDGDHTLSERVLRLSGYDSEAIIDIFDVLRAQSGCCDFEVLYKLRKRAD